MDCSIFQSREWEEFKLATGYQKSHRVGDILVLQKALPLGRTMLYSPMIAEDQIEATASKNFGQEIAGIAQENRSVFYRLELNTTNDKLTPRPASGFRKSFEEMQPENNWLVDLSQPEEKILAGMKQKGRYNIKIAEKYNIKVTYSNSTGPELHAFYNQYAKTGSRHKITYRQKKYFESLLDILGRCDYARVYIAWHGKTALASALVLFSGKAALYLYGGSSEEHREMMAPYLLHWHIMREAKERGCTEYNFLGVAPNEDPGHPWSGITRFKKQFGGFQVDILGCYDLPIRKVEYKSFKFAELIRRRNKL